MSATGSAPVQEVDDESDNAEYNYKPSSNFRRYPIHDCCEFSDASSLKELIFVRKEDSDSSDDSLSSSSSGEDNTSSQVSGVDEKKLPEIVSNQESKEENNRENPKNNYSKEKSDAFDLIPSNSKSSRDAIKAQEKPSGQNEGLSEGKLEKIEKEKNETQTQNQTNISSQIEHIKSTPKETEGMERFESTSKNSLDSNSNNDVHKIEEKKYETALPASFEAVTENMKSLDNTQEKSSLNSEEANSDLKEEDISASLKNSTLQKENDKVVERESKTNIEYYCPYDIDERDEDENTAIHIAIHARKIECVRLLLEAGANVHKRSDGSAPIHLAISIGSIHNHSDFASECLSLLRSFNADLSVKDDSLHTPLYLSCMYNLPRCATIILSDVRGLTTLNLRADRIGGRPLHACAKFDVLPRRGARVQHSLARVADEEATLTKTLLATKGIEVDPMNNYGRTPLHVAAACGNWPVARLLIHAGASPNQTDRRGLTPSKLAARRGMVIPNDLMKLFGLLAPSIGSASCRDLIMDPDARTILICHEMCNRHRSCPPITRGGIVADPPPENVRRLQVLLDEEAGILRSKEFQNCAWETNPRRAAMADIFKVHEYPYIEKINQVCSSLPDHSSAIASLDADTTISRWSFEAAMRAAGSVCEAVDKIMAGDYRNAFCAIRPPGHHAGPRGIVSCANDPEGSHGFCLLNNVAIGAAYARSMYRNDGIRKVAIIDFDVHHGNGTEEIVQNLVPHIDTSIVRTPFATGSLQTPKYRPWLNEEDVQNVFFASTHGFGPRDRHSGGWFYPASGKSMITEAVRDQNFVDRLSLSDFLLTQSWTRMGEDARTNCCKIIDVGLPLPRGNEIPGIQRIQVRDAYRKNILPRLLEFKPDMIFISAGFDGHKKDTMNFGYCGMIEDDYEWITEQLVKVANSCCQGRVISVLEGGYKIHGGLISPFARSVASHVRALVDGGSSRELFDEDDGTWESQFELQMVEEKERRRQQKLEKLKSLELDRRRLRTRHAVSAIIFNESMQHASDATLVASPMIHPANINADQNITDMEGILNEPLHEGDTMAHSSAEQILAETSLPQQSPAHQEEKGNENNDNDQVSRKRRRSQVDYKLLYEQMKKESFAN